MSKGNRWHRWGYIFGKALGWIILGFIAYWIIWAIATLGFIINEVNRMQYIKPMLYQNNIQQGNKWGKVGICVKVW